MCGICGKVYIDRSRRIEDDEITAMRDTMVSRGPDAGGNHLDRYAGLGHRRLSIIDLAASVQPMSNEDGTVWIVFNGEIYNFAELRSDLLARGHRFRTAGDTEVIIHLYEEFGEECVTRLRGMFAFAIWDSRSDSLFIARDRIGIKPVYYALDQHAFLFGSELKALLADERFWETREMDLDAVHSYLSFLSVPDPVCIYRGVRKLPAGHTLTLRDGKVALRRYWNVTFQDEDGVSEETWGERVLELMREAVRIRLVSDVPLGAFLSGGIDSSTVVALMAGMMDRPVKTFSIGFSERAHNETSDAKRVAQHLKTDHTELILSPAEARSVIPQLLVHFDEPFADSSAIPTYYVSKLARERVTVALSGDGGDELFGGYPWRQVQPSYQRLAGHLPLSVRSGISRLSAAIPQGVRGRNFLTHLHVPFERYSLDSRAIFDEADRRALYAPLLNDAVGASDPYRHLLPHLDDAAGRSWESRMMEYDVKTYLPNDILTKVDRMSMRVSLEARVPLLDHKLVELAARIPASLKIRDGVAKHILKRIIAPYLPKEVLEKRKHGFSIPLETWLRTELKTDVLDTLRGGNQHRLFDRAAVERITDAFFRGDDSRNHQVWTLYAFELWYRNVHCGQRQTALARAGS
jgi:asparagine synthase (glutamine-hydrolysing)